MFNMDGSYEDFVHFMQLIIFSSFFGFFLGEGCLGWVVGDMQHWGHCLAESEFLYHEV